MGTTAVTTTRMQTVTGMATGTDGYNNGGYNDDNDADDGNGYEDGGCNSDNKGKDNVDSSCEDDNNLMDDAYYKTTRMMDTMDTNGHGGHIQLPPRRVRRGYDIPLPHFLIYLLIYLFLYITL
ncbi:hypothetical protein CVT25_012761 [Psilocybe cyanescens]|uniref:Uncharacterized protein n=1 Tax=Psilocybe cyanescens TaxID=93625 RepID=A0A409WCI4_PSICY|nr:hypothetical protein CVT25_012761 [Psilocybe cyanescens]